MAIILSLIAVYFGHLFKNLPLVLVSYVALFVSANSTFISMAEYLVEVTYPHNKIIVSGICYASLNVGVFIFTQFQRWVQQRSDAAWAVFSAIPFCLLGLILLALTKPEYKRTLVDEASGKDYNEQEALVNEK